MLSWCPCFNSHRYRSYLETVVNSVYDWRATAFSVVPYIRKRLWISRDMIRHFFGPETTSDDEVEAIARNKDEMINRFLAYNNKVQQEIDPSRLLVYNIKDGWGPLCAFLGVPVPTIPFPHSNDNIAFKQRISRLRTTMVAATSLLAVGSFFLVSNIIPWTFANVPMLSA